MALGDHEGLRRLGLGRQDLGSLGVVDQVDRLLQALLRGGVEEVEGRLAGVDIDVVEHRVGSRAVVGLLEELIVLCRPMLCALAPDGTASPDIS